MCFFTNTFCHVQLLLRQSNMHITSWIFKVHELFIVQFYFGVTALSVNTNNDFILVYRWTLNSSVCNDNHNVHPEYEMSVKINTSNRSKSRLKCYFYYYSAFTTNVSLRMMRQWQLWTTVDNKQVTECRENMCSMSVEWSRMNSTAQCNTVLEVTTQHNQHVTATWNTKYTEYTTTNIR